MMTHTASVIDILTQKNVVKVIAYSAALQSEKREINNVPLQAAQMINHAAQKPRLAWLKIVLVLIGHGLLIYWLATQKPLEKIQYQPVKSMMVSIVAPPSLVPEISPIVEPPKPAPKQIIKPKKVVEKIRPIDKPLERLVEATTEPIKEEIIKPEASPALVAESTIVSQAIPVIEDKYEEPRFGVSYLNNPAPNYPSMSRRLGEEGRVLMKVMVSAEGFAEGVQIERSSGSNRLDDAAVAAVKHWRFIPAKKNNQPLSAYVLVPMKFSLDN